jgi:hypothetical protein
MKRILFFLVNLILILVLSACSVGQAATATGSAIVQNGSTISAAVASDTSSATTAAAAAVVAAENSKMHESASDYIEIATTTAMITLKDNTITASGNGVVIAGNTATITSAGVYSISGSLADGQIVVNTQSKETVRLVLNGVNITSSTSAPIYVQKAKKVVIQLADNTQNTISDAQNYVYAVAGSNEPNAAIFSKADLTIYGNGALTVSGNFNDGITSKDGLIIASGTITVSAVDDGIRGKDYLVVKDGSITVNVQGDGMKSDNAEDATKGWISIAQGVVNISAGGDAINAQTDVLISGGEFTLKTGGGSGRRASDNTSAKGIKGSVSVIINAGTFNIDAADDAVHSNGSVTIGGGSFKIATADDGMHADAALTINAGDIQITKSYEGLESTVITINNGTIHVTASDDGVNAADGQNSSGGPGGRPGGQNTTNYTGKIFLYIHGGYLFVDARGDGIDINGAVEMTDGVVLVIGPTQQNNGALDYDAYFKMSGGFFVAAGSSGMAMAPGQDSSQDSVMVYLTGTQAGGTLFHIQNSAGEDILTFAPTREYQSVSFSSPKLINGETYTISTGGSSTGTPSDGLYQSGSYSSGTQAGSFTISSTVTTVGSGGGRFRPGK